MTIRVKGWDKFQHFKDRKPPWVKLHRSLLDSRHYFMLSPPAAKCLPLIWLIASEYDGFLPDTRLLAFRMRLSEEVTSAVVAELMEGDFICDQEGELINPKEQRKSNPSRYVNAALKLEVMTRDGGKCVWCDSTENLEFDHVIPVSLGGTPVIDNLQILCRSCNRKKRAMNPEQSERLATTILECRSLETETETETETEAEKRPPPARKRKPQGVTLPAWVADLGEQEAIPADDPIFEWARTTGIPRDWIALGWWAFEGRYLDTDKKYLDWRAVFRKAMREDWLRLWRRDQRTDSWVLTTAGELAQREMTA